MSQKTNNAGALEVLARAENCIPSSLNPDCPDPELFPAFMRARADFAKLIEEAQQACRILAWHESNSPKWNRADAACLSSLREALARCGGGE